MTESCSQRARSPCSRREVVGRTRPEAEASRHAEQASGGQRAAGVTASVVDEQSHQLLSGRLPGLSARICRECVRALAFQWWDAIARHDIGDSRCELCEHTGGAIYCAEHALDAIVEHRALIRSLGHRIGEPPPVDVTDLLDRGLG